MRRAPIVLAATAAGLAGTLGYKTTTPSETATAAISQTDTGTAHATASGSEASSSAAGSSGSSTQEQASASTTTVTSDAISTIYGGLQLKVTVENGKITAVENLALPANDHHSVEINSWAGPQLQQSALSHADGQVDAVSGATYTTTAYEQALQSALDKANTSSSQSSSTS